MSRRVWSRLPDHEKRVNYREYEADIDKAEEQVQHLANVLYFRSLGCSRGASCVHPERATIAHTIPFLTTLTRL